MFVDEKYDVAIELYSAAIELDPQQPTYYGNRSIANLRKELFGAALMDADAAIKLDPAYVKAYFRRASANMALGKYKLALKDYDSVRKFRPNDADAQKKFEECNKVVKRVAFLKAIACDFDQKKLIDSINLDDFRKFVLHFKRCNNISPFQLLNLYILDLAWMVMLPLNL